MNDGISDLQAIPSRSKVHTPDKQNHLVLIGYIVLGRMVESLRHAPFVQGYLQIAFDKARVGPVHHRITGSDNIGDLVLAPAWSECYPEQEPVPGCLRKKGGAM